MNHLTVLMLRASAVLLMLNAAALAATPAEFTRAALKYSTEYQAAKNQLEIASYGVEIATAAMQPQVRGSLSRQLIPLKSAPQGGGPDETNKIRAGISLTKTLFNLEQASNLEQAIKLQEAASSQIAQIGQQVVLNSYRAYLNAALAKANLRTLAERRRTVEQQLLIASSNFELGRGETTLVDELNVRAQLAELDAEQVETNRQLEASLLVLDLLAGKRPNRLHEISGSFPQLSDQDWEELAESSSLAVRASRANLQAQIAGEQAIRAVVIPSVELSANYSLRDEDTIGISLSTSLYSSGGATAGIARALAQTRAAEISLEQARRQARTDAADALLRISSQDTRIDLLAKTRDAQARRLAAATALSESGEGVAFQVIDAAADLAAAEVAIVSAKHTKLIAVLELHAAVGALDNVTMAIYDSLFVR